MPNVTMPNGDVVAFPDDMPREQIKGLIAQKFPEVEQPMQQKPNALADTAKSIGSNLVGGALDVGMILPNIVNQAVAGPQLLGYGIRDTVMGNPTTKNPKIWQPFYGSYDVEKMAGTDYEPQTTVGKVAALPSRLAGGLATSAGIQSQRGNVDRLFKDQQSGKPPTPKQVTSEDKFRQASSAYKEAESQGATLYPKATDSFIEKSRQIMPQTEAGKIVTGETPSTKLIGRLQELRGKHLDLRSAQEIDEALGQAMSGETNPITGKLTAEGTKIFKIQQTLRETIKSAAANDLVGGKKGFDTWNKARQLWSDAAKMRDIENIMARAEMTDNPVTSLKTGFRNLSISIKKGKVKGYSPQEIKAINRAARTGIGTDVLRLAGSRLGPIVMGGAGYATGGPLGAMAGFGSDYAAASAARGLANKFQMGRANDVLGMIANRGQLPIPQQPIPNQFPAGYNPILTPMALGALGNSILK